MAWETRNGRGRYYTRSRKINGRVVREYVGTGLIGELAAAQDAQRRAERLRKKAAWKAAKAEIEGVDEAIEVFWARVTWLTRLVLVSQGYYRHNRGEWRKRRAKEQTDGS